VIQIARFWNFIKNAKEPEEVELRIEGEIVSDDEAWIYEWFGIDVASPNAFRKELAEHKGKNITVWVDSWGGDVFAAAGMYNALKEHKGKVTTKVDGKAVSAGSVIAMAGDEILMSPVSIMMIHNPWSRATGEAKDMRKAADVLDEVKETIMNAYQLKTGKDRAEISDLMDEESWMSAKKAMNEGFVDGVLYSGSTEMVVENSYTLSGMAIQNSVDQSMQKFFEQMKKMADTQPERTPEPQNKTLQANIKARQRALDLKFKEV
jgi:ATP-dependent Clp protease protease subunit